VDLPVVPGQAQARLTELARMGTSVVQPIDPHSPPVPCGCKGCPSDATWITKVPDPDGKHGGRDGVVGVYACDGHVAAMGRVVAELLNE
jgi:hypothetical protein